MPFTARRSPPPNAPTNMTPEERDERTIFILQIARQTRPRDLEEFFSSVGHVRDVRIITDSKTRRSKGIAYVEFWEREAVPLSLALNGQNLLGAPLVIQQTCAERNRLANGTVGGNIGLGPMSENGNLRLCISQLHTSITHSMLMGIFEPFGKIDGCEVVKDRNGVSRGFGYVTYVYAEDGKRALEQLNGFELAGRSIKVAAVDEEDYQSARQQDHLDDDRETLNAGGRLQLMAKLAEGSGMELPESAQQALKQQQHQAESAPPVATQCFMLTNMFDPVTETEPDWDLDIRDDVIEQCEAFGGIYHIHVDKESQGNVFIKCPSISVAAKAVSNLHGRYFAGKVIVANYIPVSSYHDLFPDAVNANTAVVPRN